MVHARYSGLWLADLVISSTFAPPWLFYTFRLHISSTDNPCKGEEVQYPADGSAFPLTVSGMVTAAFVGKWGKLGKYHYGFNDAWDGILYQCTSGLQVGKKETGLACFDYFVNSFASNSNPIIASRENEVYLQQLLRL